MVAVSQQVQNKVSTADLAQQADFSRKLQSVRNADQLKQKNERRHVENIAQEMKKQPYKTPTTESRKKQELKSRQRIQARLIRARKRNKAKARIQKQYYKIIAQYARTPWMVLYVAAFTDAFFDILMIPVLSTIASFCASLYINIRMWNIGGKKGRVKRRLLRASISAIDLIPIINIIPFSIIIIYKTKEDERKRVEKAKRKIKLIKKG